MIVEPDGISVISKVTKPRLTKFEFLPDLISRVVLPPLLLLLKPSRDAVDERTFDLIMGVGVITGLGFLPGVNVRLTVGVKTSVIKVVGCKLYVVGVGAFVSMGASLFWEDLPRKYADITADIKIIIINVNKNIFLPDLFSAGDEGIL